MTGSNNMFNINFGVGGDAFGNGIDIQFNISNRNNIPRIPTSQPDTRIVFPVESISSLSAAQLPGEVQNKEFKTLGSTSKK